MPTIQPPPLRRDDLERLQPGDSVVWRNSDGYFCDRGQPYVIVRVNLTLERVIVLSKKGEFDATCECFALPPAPDHSDQLAKLLGV